MQRRQAITRARQRARRLSGDARPQRLGVPRGPFDPPQFHQVILQILPRRRQLRLQYRPLIAPLKLDQRLVGRIQFRLSLDQLIFKEAGILLAVCAIDLVGPGHEQLYPLVGDARRRLRVTRTDHQLHYAGIRARPGL